MKEDLRRIIPDKVKFDKFHKEFEKDMSLDLASFLFPLPSSLFPLSKGSKARTPVNVSEASDSTPLDQLREANVSLRLENMSLRDQATGFRASLEASRVREAENSRRLAALEAKLVNRK